MAECWLEQYCLLIKKKLPMRQSGSFLPRMWLSSVVKNKRPLMSIRLARILQRGRKSVQDTKRAAGSRQEIMYTGRKMPLYWGKSGRNILTGQNRFRYRGNLLRRQESLCFFKCQPLLGWNRQHFRWIVPEQSVRKQISSLQARRLSERY